MRARRSERHCSSLDTVRLSTYCTAQPSLNLTTSINLTHYRPFHLERNPHDRSALWDRELRSGARWTVPPTLMSRVAPSGECETIKFFTPLGVATVTELINIRQTGCTTGFKIIILMMICRRIGIFILGEIFQSLRAHFAIVKYRVSEKSVPILTR